MSLLFTDFFEKEVSEKLGICDSFTACIGVGPEYVVINGEIVAKFIDGNLAQGSVGNTKETR